MKSIVIKGARENNLKNIDLTIPRNKITCLVGVSGSGKSSIAYNVIYAEGQRQFLESISTFASRLLKRTNRPDIDSISNLSPTISIDQKKLTGSPRSTVGTTTEIYTFLRLLFSRFGSTHNLSAGHFSFNNPKGACKKCKGIGIEFEVDPNSIVDFNKSLSEGASRHNNYKPGSRLYNIIESSGRLNMNKKIKDYSKEELDFLLYTDRVELSNQDQGFIQRFSHEGIITRLQKRSGDLRGTSERKDKTDKPFVREVKCSECNGGRLNISALSSKINGLNIGEYSNLQIDKLIAAIAQINISEALELKNRIIETCQYLIDVKLDYLNLNRGLDTLSGGEAQRLKLARELGNELVEIIYIMDEPTSGLHNFDRENVLKIIKSLKDKGNTIILIEHNKGAITHSEHIIEIGPKAGRHGGEIVFTGSIEQFKESKTLTTEFIFGNETQVNANPRKPKSFIHLENVSTNNLKNISCDIPLGVMCAFTGVSGSGKSSLLMDEFAKTYPGKVVIVGQKSLSGMARGNSSTYIGAFDYIRDLFAIKNNINRSMFTFNGQGGCPDCKGLGYRKIDMHFMGDITVQCETCFGKRYKNDVLNYKYQGQNISEVLNMTINEAYEFFTDENIRARLNVMKQVGLGYIELGQSHNTLSGGEGQRLKLASELHKKGEIYIIDEPSSGLHYYDLENLYKVLNKLVENGNSVLFIDHNIELIKRADYIIDLGPGGGDKGGEVVAFGTPEEIRMNKESVTGRYL